jgi:site-specific DNA-methyltransferase (adenine-specific)
LSTRNSLKFTTKYAILTEIYSKILKRLRRREKIRSDKLAELNKFLNRVIQGDCLEVMRDIPDGSVDMILCDLPYGTTACKWDAIIPFEPLWEQYERIIKDNGAIVLTASQPFASALLMSNHKLFKYELIWDKVGTSSGVLAKKRPLKSHENILVFYKQQPTYNPQMREGIRWHRGGKMRKTPAFYGESKEIGKPFSDRTNLKYPKSIITVSNANRTHNIHPTQKPVPLFEYLIRTYTKEGEIVLDNCIGSGTTAVAAINTNRQFIGIEREPEYVEIANNRIEEARAAKAGAK